MMEAHEIAELFPAIDGELLKELDADIAERGVEEPITIYEGKVLDGVHRYMLGTMHGKHVPSRPLPEGADPIAFCVARNLRRRHLSASQRAIIAEALANHRRPGRKGERTARTRREAAEEVGGCSERAVARARTVRKECDGDVVRAVRDGQVSLSDAERVRGESAERQREAVSQVKNGEAKSLIDAMERAEEDARKKRARAKKSNGAAPAEDARESVQDTVAMPPMARVHRAREVLGTIDTDAASSARVNATVAARHWCEAGDVPKEWGKTAWLRADDIDPDADAESAQRVLDALEEGALESALIETYGALSNRWAGDALERCERIALGGSEGEPVSILLGSGADTAAFERVYARNAVVFERAGAGSGA